MYRKILICTDGSALSILAAKHAVGLAKALGASVVALYVTPPFQPPEGIEDSPWMPAIRKHMTAARAGARKSLGAVADLASKSGVACTTHHLGGLSAVPLIIETATKERCDLIVMGSHGRDSLGRILLGSVTARILETCSVPVLVVRAETRVGRQRAEALKEKSRKP